MLIKPIKYTDYRGVERTEEFVFSFSKRELMEMQVEKDGGLDVYLKKIANAKDPKAIMATLKDIILKSYGEVSDDGKKFKKYAADGHRLSDDFEASPAFDELYMEVATNDVKALEFIKAILPADLAEKINDADINKSLKELGVSK